MSIKINKIIYSLFQNMYADKITIIYNNYNEKYSNRYTKHSVIFVVRVSETGLEPSLFVAEFESSSLCGECTYLIYSDLPPKKAAVARMESTANITHGGCPVFPFPGMMAATITVIIVCRAQPKLKLVPT